MPSAPAIARLEMGGSPVAARELEVEQHDAGRAAVERQIAPFGVGRRSPARPGRAGSLAAVDVGRASAAIQRSAANARASAASRSKERAGVVSRSPIQDVGPVPVGLLQYAHAASLSVVLARIAHNGAGGAGARNIVQARSVNLREHILDVASGLFYKHGVRNVGIDRIIGESGIARMTLYNHFKSKDLLIEEYLRRASSRWMKWYAGKIERSSEDPRERVLAAFSVLDGWFRSRDFRGCSVTNAMVELADEAHPAAAVKDEYHDSLRRLFGGLVRDAGSTDPTTSWSRS